MKKDRKNNCFNQFSLPKEFSKNLVVSLQFIDYSVCFKSSREAIRMIGATYYSVKNYCKSLELFKR